MSPPAERYRRRADAFEAKVVAVAPDQWSNQSPCENWDARGVVEHIVFMHSVMLRPFGRELTQAPTVAQDPVAAFRAARADVEPLLADPGVADSPVPTPMGEMSFGEHVDGVVSADLVLHGWDLAKATGQDATMDATEVERSWPGVSAMGPEMHTPDFFGPGITVFGPVVPVPDDAPLQDRLLGAIGRDPYWTPGT